MNPRKRAAISSKDNEQFGQGWKSDGGCSGFDQLPQALVMEVLSRLSIKALFNCRCVCKDWLSIISDPQFDHLRRSTSPISILIKTPLWKPYSSLSLTLVDECADSDLWIEELNFTNSLPVSKFGLINSCNGLICLSGDARYDPYYVCNPILGEFITIPPTRKGRSWGSFFGFGFSIATNEYKVLQMSFSDNFAAYEAEIYTIGAGVWRSIGNAPIDFPELRFNAYLCGVVHWVSYSGTVSKLINTFNFETEQFGRLPSPTSFGHRKKQLSESFKVGVLGGCLLLSAFEDDSFKINMWVMKKYGVPESWTKMLVIENLYPTKLRCCLYEPIMLLSSGEILMVYNDWDVVCYNKKVKSFRVIRITETPSLFDAIAYRPSFVSLYKISKGEQVMRLEEVVVYVIEREVKPKLWFRYEAKTHKLLAEGCCHCGGSVTKPLKSVGSSLDLTPRTGTTCSMCGGHWGYVFRGKRVPNVSTMLRRKFLPRILQVPAQNSSITFV